MQPQRERAKERARHLIAPSGSVRSEKDTRDDLLHPSPHSILPLSAVSSKYIFWDGLDRSAGTTYARDPHRDDGHR